MLEEQRKLETAIAALESQRGLLGDAVVEMALAPLRERLAALASAAAEPAAPRGPEQSLKQVTILFLDVVGSTTLSQHLDPEETHAVMDGALQRCTAIVVRHGGRVLQYAGDSLLAVFGADGSREDDAERAVHCGLALLAEGRLLGHEVERQHGRLGFNVRVGLHTAAVLLGGGLDAESNIRGLGVNIAARMEQTAPPGALRISQDTYRQVRGLFDVEAQPPIQVKGIDHPLPTYLVQRARPRAFRAGTRGVEGVEVRMVGRDAELAALQQAFLRVQVERRFTLAVIAGDAGVGKSRLLYEFSDWCEARPEPFLVLQGRAHPQTQSRPFGLLRDVLAWRLQIADQDSMAVAMQKFEHGLVPLFEPDDGPELARAHTHLLGHLVGLDFGASPHVQGILDDPKQIRARGFHAAALVFRRMSAVEGLSIMLQLDDLHWADEGSLEFLGHLARVNHDLPILLLCLTRPTLFERRAEWAAVDDHRQRIDLRPLGKDACQSLVIELLKKLSQVPAALSELIIGRSEGNPFYMEELVKMLVDQGALETGPEIWTLNPERLMATSVPSTLTGVLQARLDGLPASERLALQQASVIGLVFWDQALAALDARAPRQLPALERRELALPRPDADRDGIHEYAFKHQFLHDVAYDTLLKRVRRELHARAAAWLAGRTGVQSGDLLGAAADHFEKAGDHAQAREFFARAAERARARFAHEAALGYVERALALAGEGTAEPELQWRLLDVRERTFELQGRRPQQRADLEALERLAVAMGDTHRRAELATRRSLLAGRSGDYAGQEAAAREAMALAAQAADDALKLSAQRLLADALARQGDSAAGHAMALEGLAQARARGLRAVESRFLNALTMIAGRQQDLVAMLAASQQATRLRRELGDRRNEAIGLASQGSAWLELGALDQARRDLEEGLRLHRAVGDRGLEPIALANLSQLALWQGDAAQALAHAREALDLAVAAQAADLEALALWCLGHAGLHAGEVAAAATAFERARIVTESIGSASRHDAVAGLARVALARGDLAAALQAVDSLLAAGAADGTLEGSLGLRLIQRICLEVLQRAGDPRVADVLAAVHAALQAHASTISDGALRQSFLDRVPENRAIVAAWAAAQKETDASP
jgi:class 3 adenylate cyclase/tetratricopeptide (TPR) repeat protein